MDVSHISILPLYVPELYIHLSAITIQQDQHWNPSHSQPSFHPAVFPEVLGGRQRGPELALILGSLTEAIPF